MNLEELKKQVPNDLLHLIIAYGQSCFKLGENYGMYKPHQYESKRDKAMEAMLTELVRYMPEKRNGCCLESGCYNIAEDDSNYCKPCFDHKLRYMRRPR